MLLTMLKACRKQGRGRHIAVVVASKVSCSQELFTTSPDEVLSNWCASELAKFDVDVDRKCKK